jgi:hypothetical protein
MTIGNCKICGKPAKGLKGKASYCSAECVRQNERNKAKQHHATFSPERKLARNLVATAIVSGKLKRQPCEVCGTRAADAHHDDYAKPLDVRWLCRGCHKRHHVKFGPGKNAYAAQGSIQ